MLKALKSGTEPSRHLSSHSHLLRSTVTGYVLHLLYIQEIVSIHVLGI